ncbi:unnamed protein product [Porites lobata]|uniref:Uncharacterized protein n=1 Tax=Porites lobata TaxID=104759 RepID=A0ABN8P8Q6_9CNID|nr:unnamed protein product [Porites lobata]
MDSSPEPGTSSFFFQYEEEEEAMRKALEESLLDSRRDVYIDSDGLEVITPGFGERKAMVSMSLLFLS